VLLGAFHANSATFQSGWFVESLLTELAVVAVMRTVLPFYRQAPSLLLVAASAVVAAVAIALPYTVVGALVGLLPLPLPILATLIAIVGAYVLATELLKVRISPLGAMAPA